MFDRCLYRFCATILCAAIKTVGTLFLDHGHCFLGKLRWDCHWWGEPFVSVRLLDRDRAGLVVAFVALAEIEK